MTERTIRDAANWTKNELVAHVMKRHRANLPNSAIARDLKTVTYVILAQATHLQESSRALISQASNLKFDLERKRFK